MRRALFAAALLATSASLALADGYAASQDSAKAAKATNGSNVRAMRPGPSRFPSRPARTFRLPVAPV